MIFLATVWLAWLLDLLFGDPRWLYHPVRGIGCLCIKLEKLNRHLIANEKTAGLVTGLEVLFCTGLCCCGVLFLFYTVSVLAMLTAATVLLYTTFALWDLLSHAESVAVALVQTGVDEQQALAAARNKVAMIVGRDTASLSREGVVRACIESVAENMSDGAIAPLFYGFAGAFLAGDVYFAPAAAVLGAMLYKAVNTMDSVFGYKNERYLHFGWFAAKCDDVVNLIPARITALMIIMAAPLCGHDPLRTIKITVRDRCKHSSPNGGYPEAAMAGALNIQLGGPSYYFGTLENKSTLGDSGRQLEAGLIRQANQLLFTGSFIAVFLFSLCYKFFFCW